jgi:hypothetical protein
MKRGAALGLILAFCTGIGVPHRSTELGFWRGKFQLFQFNFLYSVGVEDRNLVRRDVEVWQTDYDLVQSPAGIVREELTHMNWHPSVEGPMGVRLLDYNRGVGIVFDKGRLEAYRGPLQPPATAVPLEERQILGFLCDGKEYDWTTSQRARVQLQRWSARNSDFKVPLLQVEYFTKENGDLLSLRVEEVSEIESASDIPASFFQSPPGLHLIDVPSIE